MYKQGCPACNFAQEKSDRIRLGGPLKFMLTFLTLIMAWVTVVQILVDPGVAIIVDSLLAVPWFVYIKNHIIGWRGPGSFLNQLDEVHSHLFVRSVWPVLFHRRAEKEVQWGGGDARVCSPLIFAQTTGWFRRRRIWTVDWATDTTDGGLNIARHISKWRLMATTGNLMRLCDSDGSQVSVFLEEALRLVAEKRPLLKQYRLARLGLAECEEKLTSCKQKIAEREDAHISLGHDLTALLVAAQMEKAARPSPQARWMRVVLFQLLERHWKLPDVMQWIEQIEHRHREAKVTIADAVAQAEQRRAEASSPQTAGQTSDTSS